MHDQVLGTLARRANDAISRRTSLLTLGAIPLATLAQSTRTATGKKNNKKLKKKKCKKQVGQCTDFLTAACLNDPVCESAITCCGLFANCDAAAALPCIFTN